MADPDFAKFVDMLDRETLFFARADTMVDPWEGGISSAGVDEHVAHLIELQASTLLPAGYVRVQGWDDRVALRRESIERVELARRRTYLSCWFMAEHESAAMWSLYAGQGRGIAVRSTFSRLEVAFPREHEHSIHAGTVEYIDYTQQSPPLVNEFFPFLTSG